MVITSFQKKNTKIATYFPKQNADDEKSLQRV